MSYWGSVVGGIEAFLRRKQLPDVVISAESGIEQIVTSERRPTSAPFAGTAIFGRSYDADSDRIAAYRDYRILDANVPELSRALTIIAANTTVGAHTTAGRDATFTLAFADGVDATDQRIAQDVVERIELRELMKQVIRASNKMGDVFAQVIYDQQGVIRRLKFLEPELVSVMIDDDKIVGYKYRGYNSQEQNLAPFEVIHLKHDPELGAVYGRSIFAGGGRSLGHRVLTIRDALTYETLCHSTARNAIFLPRPMGMPEDKRREWIGRMADMFARERVIDSDGVLSRRAIAMLNQQHVVVDYPVDADGKGAKPEIQPLQNTPLEKNIAVAEHFQDLLFTLTGVPKAYMGLDRQTDGLSSQRVNRQDIQFARQLNAEQQDAAWFVAEVIRHQYVLLGRKVPTDSISVLMPDLREEDKKLRAEVWRIKSEAAKMSVEIGLPLRAIWSEILFDGEQEVAVEMAARYGVDLDSVPSIPPASSTATEHLLAQARIAKELFEAVQGASATV